MQLSLVLLLAVAAPPRLTLDQAIEIGLEQANAIIQAIEDRRQIEVEATNSLAPVLPRVDVLANAQEIFFGDNTVETRTTRALPPSTFTPADVFANQRIGIGPFIDVNIAKYSQPNFNLTLQATQLIYDGGRWWSRLARVDHLRDSRDFAVETARNNVRLSVVSAFYGYAKAIEAVKAIEQQVALSRTQLERANAMLRAGSGKSNDVATAQRNLSSDRVTLARARFTASRSMRSLNIAMGRSPSSVFALEIPKRVAASTVALDALVVAPTDELLALAVQQRPEIRKLRADIASLRKNVDMSSAGYWPTLSMFARYTRWPSRRPDRIFNFDLEENYQAFAGLDFRWNLFSGRTTVAAVEGAEISVRKTEASYENSVRQVEREVLDGVENLRVLYEVFRLARQGAGSAEEAVRLADGQYKQGRGTSLELRDAELRLTQARLGVIEARFDIEVALETLRRAVGSDRDHPGVL